MACDFLVGTWRNGFGKIRKLHKKDATGRYAVGGPHRPGVTVLVFQPPCMTSEAFCSLFPRHARALPSIGSVRFPRHLLFDNGRLRCKPFLICTTN